MAGVFDRTALTAKGKALLAKAQANLCSIQFTRAVTGNGLYAAGEDLEGRTALKSQKQTFSLNTVSVWNSSYVYVKFIITNYKSATDYLTQSYDVTEVGLYAQDPDEGEILYCIALAAVNKWDYMPAWDNLVPTKITINLMAEVANSETVTIVMPNRMYLYDNNTGDKYELGVENGLLYYEEVEE